MNNEGEMNARIANVKDHVADYLSGAIGLFLRHRLQGIIFAAPA